MIYEGTTRPGKQELDGTKKIKEWVMVGGRFREAQQDGPKAYVSTDLRLRLAWQRRARLPLGELVEHCDRHPRARGFESWGVLVDLGSGMGGDAANSSAARGRTACTSQ